MENTQEFLKYVDTLLEKYPHNLRKAAKLFSEKYSLPQKLALRLLQGRMLTNLGL